MAGNMGGSVQINAKAMVFALAVGGIVLYFGYNWLVAGEDTSEDARVIQKGSWKTSDFVSVPKDVLDKMDAINVKQKTVEIAVNGENYKVFIQEAGEENADKINFLLLHGMAFTSQNWIDTKTIHLIAASGHRVVAVDLPGHGKTGGQKIAQDKTKTVQFLEALIKEEKLKKPVIVSPSMSGSYALPFILGEDPQSCSNRAYGYIPVAPASANMFSAEDYKKCKIPVMITFGSTDKNLGESSYEHLKSFPNTEKFIVQDAGHPCYIDQPEEWRRLVYNFIKQVL